MTTNTATSDSSRLTRLLGFLARDPGNTTLLLDALSLAIASADMPQRQRLIDHVQQHAIESAAVDAQIAHLQLLMGNYAAASAYGDKAIQAGISHPAVLLNTAYGHFYSGDYDSSAAILAKLTAQDDASVDMLLLHARALHHQAKPEPTEHMVLRALQREPAHVEAKGLLALLQYERGDNDGALRLAHDVLAQNQDQLDALLACGAVHFEQGRIEASRKTWLHTVATHPTCGRAWSGLAQLEFNELEFVPAEEHLKIAVIYMPDHIGTWHLLAWLYILQRDSQRAREALDKSYALDRNFGETHGGLAVVDALDGKDEQARVGIRRALKLDPECMSARYAEMLILQKEGKSEAATAAINQVFDRNAPGSNYSGRVLVERWLETHQGKASKTPPGQH